jgi:transketolase
METKRATIMAGEMKGPFYIRFGRPSVPMFTTEETPFEYGKAFNFREGSDLAIFANGHMVWAALEAADMLKEKKGIEARVVNCCWVKPMDHEAVVSAAKDCGAIVTAEEHQVHGGLGAAVAESVVKNYPVPMEFVGMADEFGRSGEPFELMEHYELNANTIYASSLKVLERKEKGYIGTRKISDISRISDYQ